MARAHTSRPLAVIALLVAIVALATAPRATTAQAAQAAAEPGDGLGPEGVGPHTWTVTPMTFDVATGPNEDIAVTIDADLYRPDDATAATPAPAMFVQPGFGIDKTGGEVTVLGSYFASYGYVVVVITPQGFGASTGCISLDSRAYDNRNARQVIDWLDAQDYVLDEAPGDPAVGMIGGSYGGGLQAHTAIADPRIDAIAPGRTWVYLGYSLDPNNWIVDPAEPYDITPYDQGVFKLGWTSLFFASGSTQSLMGNGGCDPITQQLTYPGTLPCPSFLPGTCEVYARLATTGDATASDLAFVDDKSLSPELGLLDVPTLLPYGQPDTLFTPTESISVLLELQSRGVPVATWWHSSGHGGHAPAPGDGEAYGGGFDATPEQVARFADGYFARRSLNWMERYVRGRTEVDTGPAFAWFRDWVDYDATASGGSSLPAYDSATTFPPPRSTTLDLTLDPGAGTLVAAGGAFEGGSATFLNPPGGQPGAYSELPNFSSPGAQGDQPATDIDGLHVAFDSAELTVAVDVVGVPILTVDLSHANVAIDARVFAKLWDVAPDGSATLIRRQVAASRIPSDALSEPVQLRLPPTVYRFEAGHRIRLSLASTDAAYFNERLPDTLTVSSTADLTSRLSLPVIPAPSAPPAAAPEPEPTPAPTAPLPTTGGGLVLVGLLALGAASRVRRGGLPG